ncbi:hypothetical protein CWE09_07770 [Aliidiomarina minuta]|uniref:histidine kinase n=1 Tax=Aliidiomarina minuta TaxID=880057 RepID=A0A432W8W6_9GAMM|nr:ATP-binding protein [Aliidiomarina minuta]RUO26590.1 hypothetical protein CWE09_07770 [Aliidiomarina minuta]
MKNSAFAVWLGVFTLAIVILVVSVINAHKMPGPAVMLLLALIVLTALHMVWRQFQLQQNQISAALKSLINQDSDVKLANAPDMQALLEEVQQAISQNRTAAEVQANYLKALVAQLDIGVVEFDHEGHIVNSNPAAERLVSLDFIHAWRAFTSGRSHHAGLSYRDNLNRLHELLHNGKSNARGELIWHYPNRKETFLYSKIQGFIGGQPRTLLTLQSIEKQMVAQEVKAYQQLVKVLTHEVANSITPMVSLTQSAQGFADRLEPASPENAEQLQDLQEALTTVARRGQHLTEFMNSFKALSQTVNARLTTTKLAESVNEVLRLMADKTEGVKLSIDIPETLDVTIDPALFEQVLINLLTNAVEATSEQSKGHITITATQSGEHSYLDITDNGPGIHDHTAASIFVPFFTTKTQGSGIGLPLARSLMLSQGGDLVLCSQGGSQSEEIGARFRVVFG